MSYLALARKCRPLTFSQLIGQEHINRTLINALNQNRLHHAYLFTGTRGVGKTSIARILAKALNCEQGIQSEPCLQCDVCTAIDQGRFIDLIEIDGASKTRVEDTRELLDNVQYAPTSGRFKIYLIDEVHMLSQHSFNALLKTLEEPPSHVKFILATTDPQKLPVTVLSRCLQFNLRPLSPELIQQHLQDILKEEQVDYETQALQVLAQAAKGSMRDALSLLDQAIAHCDQGLSAHEVKTILGYTQQDYALKILQALAEQNPQLLLKLSKQIADEGGHFQYVLDELLHYFHQISIYQSIGDQNPFISPDSDVKELAQQFTAEDIQLFYQFALKACEDIHLAPTLTIGFNMTLIRMLTFRPASSPLVPPLTFEQKVEPEPPKTEPIHWNQIIQKLGLTGLAFNAIENTEFIAKEGAELTLRIAKGHKTLFSPAILKRIETALAGYYQGTVRIHLENQDTTQASPAQQKKKNIEEKQDAAKMALESDPTYQQIQKEFSAEVINNSIVLLKDNL